MYRIEISSFEKYIDTFRYQQKIKRYDIISIYRPTLRTSDLENFSCFVNLPSKVFLVLRKATLFAEKEKVSVLSVLVVFKDVVNNGRDGYFFLAARLSSHNTGVTRSLKTSRLWVNTSNRLCLLCTPSSA